MKKSLLTLAVFAFLAFTAANSVAQQSSAGTAPVHVVVTVEAQKGGETPVINREDVMVHEGHDRDPVVRQKRCAYRWEREGLMAARIFH
jgi:hypothetical protein